jgi:hypothetical protein
MGSADLPEFAACVVKVFIQRLAATFLPPNQLTDKILLRHTISHRYLSSTARTTGLNQHQGLADAVKKRHHVLASRIQLCAATHFSGV